MVSRLRCCLTLFAVALLVTGLSPRIEGATSAPQESKAPEKAAKAKAVKVKPSLSQANADQVKWRSIGPANMSGRITALAVNGNDHSNWWAATASGGLLKTVNNGVTFEHQFDDQATVSIGDVQVSHSNPEIVWVGTGESNPRNSVSWGDGVYKSTDGGKTWKNMGLKKTFQTGALAIHPDNPDVVWVGSLGRLWGPNTERGLFKTSDGGKTWKKTLYVDDKTGVIDVQVNPKNADEMLVATYERKRDGFDGNDPMQRFGAGAGIYKSIDGGESFQRITKGLPSCKMGRIGLDYHEADPNIVVAIVESEKIAKEPEDYSFAGLRGEDADVGARVVTVTKDGPADKAGLKKDDIVVSVDGRVIPSYKEMLREVHKKLAGDTVKLVVSRERKLVDIEIELGKKPKPASGRSSRSDFTGTLGGQAGNLQDTQGPDGHEYGGVYLSEDGGSSWERINSLNPRPMYYSNIQIDPVDRNNIYVCGTSLYRSSDGGKTFTGDGGSDGIHVDHHALWIDNQDPRCMILGNDGGIHLTHDRMEHWDHYNHVAIGQFYHVGVDSNLDYKVYGGLQDNGSWGGPARGEFGSGPINSDWFRVGSGDGFVTLVDPEDPNQIYYESQNGGMGRIHLETGARGFNQPRERGKRFRFNWKTPYMLSPHNSRIFYSAGNHVFKSLKKGTDSKRISPEITNTDKGAGSAITESPMESGVLYVGTTDGAVWMTKDGGQNWSPLSYQPEEKKKDEKKPEDAEEAKKSTDVQGEKASDSAAESADPISGVWEGKMISDRIPEDRAAFSFTLKLDDGKVSGEMEGRRGPVEISDGTFDAETGKLAFSIDGGRGSREYSGIVKAGKLSGEMDMGGDRQILFEATKKKSPAAHQASAQLSQVAFALLANGMTSSVSTNVGLNSDDPISGEWDCVVEAEGLPNGRIEFVLTLNMSDKNELSGQLVSQMGVVEVTEGVYVASSKRILISAANDQFELDFRATVDGSEMTGTMEANGELEAEFTAIKVKAEVAVEKEAVEEEAATEKDAGSDETKPAAAQSESKKPSAKSTEMQEPPKTQDESQEEGASDEANDDVVSGTWAGELISQQGAQDFTLNLKRTSNSQITGTFESTRGEREISSGTFDPETKALTLVAQSDDFTFEIRGPVNDDTYAGEIDFNEGAFIMEFSVKRSGDSKDSVNKEASTDTGKTSEEDAAAKSEPKPSAPDGPKSLAAQMPGPRWVSSLEASRFKKERCYITLDGHRSNDDATYAFVSNDYGQTWESLTGSLPANAGSARVLREDLVNQNLLFLGCEFSAWYSIDTGKTWTRIKGGLPTVSVHEFAIHPKAGEVVAATHGRSLWVADISVLRQLSPETLAKPAHLYQAKDAIRWRSKPIRGSSGTRKFVGTNPNSGTTIAYSLGKNARQISLEIVDVDDNVVKTFEPPRTQGFHMLEWDLRRDSSGRSRQSVSTGDYTVRLKVDGQRSQNRVAIVADPSVSAANAAELEAQQMREEFELDLLGESID